METQETYNGWANRETWALMLHINNDEGLYEMYREMVREGAQMGQEVYEIEASVSDSLGELLDPVAYRDAFGDSQSEALAMMAREVGSLWRVDWAEVVASLSEG